MKRIAKVMLVVAMAFVSASFLLDATAWAVPSYARRYGMECSDCHTMWGALNGSGVTFRLSGYRAISGSDLSPIEKDYELSKDMTIPANIPLSMITGVGFDYRTENRQASAGTSSRRTAASLDLEDASFFLTAPLGPHLSAFMEFPMYETRAWEFTPTGPAEANDTAPGRNSQFVTESPAFEVAKFWWNNIAPGTGRDSVNLLAGITQLPLGYPSGKVRLSVNQYLIYERRALDLISPNKPGDMLNENENDYLFRLSEPQIIAEVNGMVVPFGKQIIDVSFKETFWWEYHLGITNGSNSSSDNNPDKDFYGRFVMRWYNQSVGLFAYYSPDTYDDALRTDASRAFPAGIMSGSMSRNSSWRIGPDATLSLAPFGVPVWLENQFLYNTESNPTGFGQEFRWWGGFHQLNWQKKKNIIAYARYDWINGSNYDDRASGGITVATPCERDAVAGLQYLVRQNVKFIGEYRYHVFEDKASSPMASLRDEGLTTRVMVGF